MLACTVVTCVRLQRLKASARNSTLVFSVIENLRDSLISTNQMFGCLKKLRGNIANLDEPPEPLLPPPGVCVELNPKAVGEMLPERFPVNRAPEKAFRIGAMVQPLKMCFAAPLSNGFGL